MHLRHLNGTTGATQVLPFLLPQLQFTRPRGCPGPTFPTLCPLRQVSFSVGSATPTNVSCAHFESSSDRSCAPASPATVRRRLDVPPKPNHVRILMVEPPTEIVLCVESLRVLPRIRDRVTSPASNPGLQPLLGACTV